jgi:hypothetical protein
MGIVNGLALEMVEDISYGLLRRDKALDQAVLEMIDHGDFAAIASYLKCAGDPAFYELTIDPHHLLGARAFHTLYFPLGLMPGLVSEDADLVGASESIVRFASELSIARLLEIFSTKAPAGFLDATPVEQAEDPITAVLRLILEGNESAFAYYGASGAFDPVDDPKDPGDLKPFTWANLHSSDEITGGIPGALYNASFAIPREMVSRAVPAICDAVSDLAGAFIFTLRFVSSAKGTLAFTRFEENAVIEIDGLSPFICDLKASELDPGDPTQAKIRQILWLLGEVLPEGAKRVRSALDQAGIPFSMHWAKLGDLDATKVHGDFGVQASGEVSRLERWRSARSQLLSSEAQALFWNEAVMKYGLL